MPKKFTDKQLLFIHEYMVDKNATAAALRAGYSKRYADRQGFLLISEPKIRAEVDRLMGELTTKIDITAERVLQEIAKCAFVNIQGMLDEEGNLQNPKDLPADVAASIVEVTERTTSKDDYESTEYRYKMANKLDALEKLGKHLKLFTDKVETEVTHKMSLKELMEKSAEDE